MSARKYSEAELTEINRKAREIATSAGQIARERAARKDIEATRTAQELRAGIKAGIARMKPAKPEPSTTREELRAMHSIALQHALTRTRGTLRRLVDIVEAMDAENPGERPDEDAYKAALAAARAELASKTL